MLPQQTFERHLAWKFQPLRKLIPINLGPPKPGFPSCLNKKHGTNSPCFPGEWLMPSWGTMVVHNPLFKPSWPWAEPSDLPKKCFECFDAAWNVENFRGCWWTRNPTTPEIERMDTQKWWHQHLIFKFYGIIVGYLFVKFSRGYTISGCSRDPPDSQIVGFQLANSVIEIFSKHQLFPPQIRSGFVKRPPLNITKKQGGWNHHLKPQKKQGLSSLKKTSPPPPKRTFLISQTIFDRFGVKKIQQNSSPLNWSKNPMLGKWLYTPVI